MVVAIHPVSSPVTRIVTRHRAMARRAMLHHPSCAVFMVRAMYEG